MASGLYACIVIIIIAIVQCHCRYEIFFFFDNEKFSMFSPEAFQWKIDKHAANYIIMSSWQVVQSPAAATELGFVSRDVSINI